MEPAKFIKDNLGDMIENPEWTKWIKLQSATDMMAKATLVGNADTDKDAAKTPPEGEKSTMDNVKDTVTDKKFLGGAGIGFLAGAATGAAITHVVHKKKKKGKKKKKKSKGSSSSSSSSSSDSDY